MKTVLCCLRQLSIFDYWSSEAIKTENLTHRLCAAENKRGFADTHGLQILI